MERGRPALFATVEDLDKAITGYFEYIKGKKGEREVEVKKKDGLIDFQTETFWVWPPEPPTITGLAYYLGFNSRQSFYDYEKDGDFSYTIKRARLRIENEYEKALHHQSPTGAIFALKNFGWTDKQEIDQKTEHSGGIEIRWQEPNIHD